MDSGLATSSRRGMTKVQATGRDDEGHHFIRRHQQGAAGFGRERAGAVLRPCPRPICGSGTPTTACMRQARRRCANIRARSSRSSSPAESALANRSKRRWIGRAAACWCSACMAAAPRMASCRRCARFRGIPFTGSGSASSHLAFDKISAKHFAALAGVEVPNSVKLDEIEAALDQYGRLIAKPTHDGSSYGADLRQRKAGSRRGAHCRQDRSLSDRADDIAAWKGLAPCWSSRTARS